MDCKIEGCADDEHARGYCNRHYKKWQKYGDPLAGRQRQKYAFTVEDRIAKWAVRSLTGCLIWTGPTDPDGYGMMCVDGRRVKTHRWAWEQEHGPIPAKMLIDHVYECRTPACMEATHLRPATKKQNAENVAGPTKGKTLPLGVSFDKQTGRYRAKVQHNGRTVHAGRHDTVKEAERAAVAKRLELFSFNDHDRNTVDVRLREDQMGESGKQLLPTPPSGEPQWRRSATCPR